MATIAVKITLIISLLIICYQDNKERAVWWFLFPLFFLTAGYLHYFHSLKNLFFINIGLNFLIMSVILSFSYLYAQYKMKINFFKEAFGTGDLLFFLGITLAFPTITFIVLLVFSLIFSLGLHLLLSRPNTGQTVPLAGHAALFFILIYFSNWVGIYKNLYFH